MKRVFISYKRADKEVVFALKDQIEAAIGEVPWIDIEGIESDEQFVNVIIKAIDEAEVFLFMYSHHHTHIDDLGKDWTVREINLAEKKHKRIVFVNIDGTPLTDYFEMMFGLKQQIDATNASELNRLLRDLKSWLDIPSSPGQTSVTPLPRPQNIRKRRIVSYIIGGILVLALAVSAAMLWTHSGKYTRGLEYTYNDSTRTASVSKGTAIDQGTITIPNHTCHKFRRFIVQEVAQEGFSNEIKLQHVVLPSTLQKIGYSAFFNCDILRNVEIKEGVTHIDDYAFAYCEDMQNISLPSTLTHLGRYAFRGSKSIETVKCWAKTPPAWGRSGNEIIFENKNNIKILVPEESLELYKQAKGWSNFKNNLETL